MRIRAVLDVYGDFAGVRSLAVDRYVEWETLAGSARVLKLPTITGPMGSQVPRS